MIRVVVADPSMHKGIIKVAQTTKYTSAAGNIMFTSPEHYARGWIYAALDGEEVVGFACVRHKVRQPETNVYFVGVKPERRSEGVGKLLLKLIAEKSPHDRIVLKVAKDNPRARAFYERNMFNCYQQDGEYWHMTTLAGNLTS